MELEYLGVHIETCDGVYEPAEDTFLLMDSLRLKKSDTVLEVGTGTGIVSILAAKTASHVTAVDISPLAVGCAKKNAVKNSIKNIDILKCDLFEGIKSRFDVIIFNTPYVPTEENEAEKLMSKKGQELARAWDGGTTGRRTIDRFLESLESHTNPQCRIYMVESSRSQYEKTVSHLRRQGYCVAITGRARFFFDEVVVIHAEKSNS